MQMEAELLWEDQEYNQTAGQAGKWVAEGGRWGPAARTGGRRGRKGGRVFTPHLLPHKGLFKLRQQSTGVAKPKKGSTWARNMGKAG